MNIPNPKIENKTLINDKFSDIKNENHIKFSFNALEYDDYFNLDGTCANWSSDLFAMLKNISSMDFETAKKYKTYRIHTLETVEPKNKPKSIKNVDLKDMYQIRISTAKGGIHGVYTDGVFYIMLLDPQHNMYPDDNHGGRKKINPPKTCCKDMEEELKTLSKCNIDLIDENNTYREIFNENNICEFNKDICPLKK